MLRILALVFFVEAFDPIAPPPPPPTPNLPPPPRRTSTEATTTDNSKCYLYNESLPCPAGSECIPRVECVFINTPKGRDYYCPCAAGTCPYCLSEGQCTNTTGCYWNGVSCSNPCDRQPCGNCLDTISCNSHPSQLCFWSNFTNDGKGSCEHVACFTNSCHCRDPSSCNNNSGCQWDSGKSYCTTTSCPVDPMGAACLLERTFLQASTLVPELNTNCINPYYPWEYYLPPDESPTDCETGVCALCTLGRYCPTGSTNPTLLMTVCDEGHYCPNASVRLDCPAGYYCPSPSLEPYECSEGTYCPENLTGTPDWCEKGNYCATPAEIEVCPADHYCLMGVTDPLPCPFGSVCDEGSSNPNRTNLLALTLVVMCLALALFLGVTWAKYSLSRRAATQHMQQRTKQDTVISDFVNIVNAMQGEEVSFKGFRTHTNPPVTIAFEELSLKVGQKVILQGVSGAFPHSSMVAIMGPSGAGKTSFLNVLTGKAHYGEVGGKATFNGHQLNFKEVRYEVGFVPQDDIVNDILTVRDNISWSAWLRLPASWSSARKTDIIDDVISLLGLAHIQHSVVGSVEKRGISGGQRKRVNIGMELAADPTVLFLDEPTSGLDASTTQEILHRLRGFSRLGISTAAVIHQPRYSAFLSFDYILLLGVGGRTVYLGSSQGALSYFQSIGFTCPPRENPADFFLDVVSGLIPCEKSATFKSSDLFDYWVKRGWRDENHEDESKAQTTQALWAHWKKFDVNGDNRIDKKELLAFLESVGVKMNPEKVAQLFFSNAKEKLQRLHAHTEVVVDAGPSSPRLTEQGTEMTVLSKPHQAKSEHEETISRIANDLAPEAAQQSEPSAHVEKSEHTEPRVSSAETKRPEPSAQAADPDSISLEELIDLIRAPRDLTPNTEAIRIREVPGFFRQFAYFFMRDCVRIYRQAAGVLANCVMQALVGTMLGVLYGGDWELYKLPEIGLALATFSCLFAGLLSIDLLCPERLMNYREAAAGINQHAYFLNKLLLNLLYCALHTTSFLLVFYPLINFPFEYKLLWGWVYLCFFSASGLGLLLAVVHKSPYVVVGVVLTVVNLFLGGALVSLPDLGSAAVLTYISPARWLAELILTYTLESLPSYWEATRVYMENQFDFHYYERQLAVGMLVLIGSVLRIAAYIAHFLWDRKQK